MSELRISEGIQPLGEHFVHLRDVMRIYADPTTGLKIAALRGIELTIDEGELVAIVGPSGAGKSTLLNIIGGLDFPSSGIVEVDNQIINASSPKQLDRYHQDTVGFLWQLPERNLLSNLTLLENVMFPMKFTKKIPKSQRKQRAKQLLTDVGLKGRMNHKPHQVSGGEAQRAGLAVALANDPKLILADEPTGELDSETTLKVINYIKDINKETGTTVLVVTHDYRFENVSDRAFRIKDGRISGIHQLKSDVLGEQGLRSWKGIQREEVLYCDEFGNITLPERLRQLVGIKRHVRVKVGKDHIRLYPVKE